MWAKAEAPTPSQQRAARRPAYIRGPPPAPGDRHRGARDRVGGGAPAPTLPTVADAWDPPRRGVGPTLSVTGQLARRAGGWGS